MLISRVDTLMLHTSTLPRRPLHLLFKPSEHTLDCNMRLTQILIKIFLFANQQLSVWSFIVQLKREYAESPMAVRQASIFIVIPPPPPPGTD